MKNILFFLFLLSSSMLHAKNHYLSLSKVSLDKEYSNFRVVEIIDARTDSAIGFVQKGIINEMVKAVFKNGFKKELMDFFDKSIKPSPSSIDLSIKINRLWISEKSYLAKEVSKAELDVHFFLKKDYEYVSLLETNSVTEKNDIDVTGRHDNNIAIVFSECFNELANLNLNEIGNKTIYSLDDIIENKLTLKNNRIIDELNFPIINQKPKKGIYRTFIDFLFNDPDQNEDFFLERTPRYRTGWEGTYRIFPKYVKNKKNINNIWGICSEDSIYIQFDGDLFPVFRNDKIFSFEGYYMVPSSVSSARIFIGAWSPTVVERSQRIIYKINLLTGELYAEGDVLDYANEKITSRSKIMVYRNKKETEIPVKLLVHDTVYATINPESYSSVDISLPLKKCNLCAIVNDYKSCIEVSPELDEIIYVNLSFTNKDKKTQIQKVDSKVGEYYIKNIDYAIQRKSKKPKN